MKKKVLLTTVILSLSALAFVIIGFGGGGVRLETADIEFSRAGVAQFQQDSLAGGARRDTCGTAGLPPGALLMDLSLRYSLKGIVDPDLGAILESIGPISVEATIPSLGDEPVFQITLESLSGSWRSVTGQTARMDLSASIHNRNPYQFALHTIEYRVDVGGVPLARGTSDRTHTFRPDSRHGVSTEAVVDTVSADDLSRAYVRQFLRSTFSIDIAVALELPEEIADDLHQEMLTVLIREGSEDSAVEVIARTQADGRENDNLGHDQWAYSDVYRTGTPNLDLVREFHEEFHVCDLDYASGDERLIVFAGVRIDGYYWLMIREENWDVIYETVEQLQEAMGEDFPVAISVGSLER